MSVFNEENMGIGHFIHFLSEKAVVSELDMKDMIRTWRTSSELDMKDLKDKK